MFGEESTLSEIVNDSVNNNSDKKKTSFAYEIRKRTILRCLQGLKTEEDPGKVAILLETIATSFTSSQKDGYSHTIHLSEEDKELLQQIPNPVLKKLYRRMETIGAKGHKVYITPENEWAMFFLRNYGEFFSS